MGRTAGTAFSRVPGYFLSIDDCICYPLDRLSVLKPINALSLSRIKRLAVVTRKRFWLAALLGIFILVYTVKHANLEKIVVNLQHVDILWAVLAVVTSWLSYICIAAVLHRLVASIGHKLSFSSSFKISLLSSAMNYVMAMGGLSGVAAKVYLLSRERIPPSNTLSISMIHGFLTNTVAVLFVYLGFFFLYSQYKMNELQMELGIAIMIIAFALTWITIQTIIHESFRKRFWSICFKIVLWFCSKIRRLCINQERAEAFFENFNSSLNLIVRNARILIIPALLAGLDWLFMFLCLKLSFLSVGYEVSNRVLLVGFSAGIFATIFSLTPAAIGLMEGSMAGSFYLMGLDYDAALLATLIFRFAYYFLPIMVSFCFYRRFFPPGTKHSETRAASRHLPILDRSPEHPRRP